LSVLDVDYLDYHPQAQYDLAHVRAERIRLKRLDWGLTHA
jgi:hypothetical protein